MACNRVCEMSGLGLLLDGNTVNRKAVEALVAKSTIADEVRKAGIIDECFKEAGITGES